MLTGSLDRDRWRFRLRLSADFKLNGNFFGGAYKNHLDGYDQMAAITGKGPSARHEIFYLGESTVGAVRIDDYKYRFIDQPQGWLGDKTKPDVPYITNLRLDPFERTGWPNDGTKEGAQQYFDWFKYQFWRFVFQAADQFFSCKPSTTW